MEISNHSTIEEWSQFTEADLSRFGDEGDASRKELIDPAIFGLISGDLRGESVLDAGCGNGYLARKLARLGAVVTAAEPAQTLVEYCRKRELQEPLGINYLQQDIALLSPGPRFDKVFTINVLTDIPDYKAALARCTEVLKPGGELYISVLHPAFPGFEADWKRLGHVEVEEYFDPKPVKQKYGYLFMRPLQDYFNSIIDSGCNIERIVEPRSADPVEGRSRHVPQFLIIKAVRRSS